MQQVGPYRLVRCVGRGGAGEVHEALTPDGRRVAVKLLTAFDPGGLARFARERALLAQLSTEGGFVPLLDVGDSPGGPWLVMPLLEGGTLRDRLRTGPLPVDEALRLGALLARTVGRAHARGIVHRDLKPENVLFDAQGAAFVADLGLAKGEAGPSTTPTPSLTGEMRGTAGYMAPEQMNDAKRVGPAADVFSLGVLLFEVFAGHGPFDAAGATTYEVMSRVARGAYEPLSRARPDAPRWLEAVVARCLASDPAERFADAGALAAALEAGPSAAAGARRGPLVAAGALLLVLGGVGALAASGRLGPPPSTETAPPPTTTATTSPAPPTPPTSSAAPLPPTTTAAPTPPTPPPAEVTLTLGRAIGDVALKCSGQPQALRVAARAPIVASGDDLGVVRAFDLDRGGEPVRVYDSGLGAIVDLACSPDGDRIVTVHRSGAVEVAEGRSLRRLTDLHRGKPLVVAWSADGRHVLTGADDGSATRYDLTARKQGFSIKAPSAVTLLAPSPVADLVCVGRADGTLEVWDFESRRRLEQTKVPGSSGGLSAVAWGPDNVELALGLGRGQVVRLKTTDLTVVGTSPALGSRVLALAFEPGGGIAAVTTAERVRLDPTGAVVARSALEPGGVSLRRPVVAAAIDGDGRRAVVGYERDMALRSVDLASGSAAPLAPGHDGWVFALVRDPTTGHLLTGSLDRTARLWSLEDGVELARIDLTDRVGDVCLAPDGRLAHVALLDGGGISSLRLPGLRSRSRYVLQTGVASTAWTAQGGLLIARRDGVVHVLVPESLAELTSWRAHAESLEALSVLPDGRILTRGAEVKAGSDARTTLALWDGPSIELRRHEVPPARPRAQAVAPDGSAVFVAAAMSGTVVAVELPSLRERWKVDLEGGRFASAALDPSGQLLFVGGLDRRLRVLDPKDGRLLGELLFDDYLEVPTVVLPLAGYDLLVGTSLGRLVRVAVLRR